MLLLGTKVLSNLAAAGGDATCSNAVLQLVTKLLVKMLHLGTKLVSTSAAAGKDATGGKTTAGNKVV